jgi:hypothetical protein
MATQKSAAAVNIASNPTFATKSARIGLAETPAIWRLSGAKLTSASG